MRVCFCVCVCVVLGEMLCKVHLMCVCNVGYVHVCVSTCLCVCIVCDVVRVVVYVCTSDVFPQIFMEDNKE